MSQINEPRLFQFFLYILLCKHIQQAGMPQVTIWWRIRVDRKFVNDISMAIQSNLESTAIWTNHNWMKLNASKCKEMLMCFLRERPKIQPLRVNVKVLETVKSHKVLGLIIQDCLKWNKHIEMSTSKASKRLQIIRVLRRGGIPPQDLLHIYYVLIHSVLEYCCVIWHNSQPKYLSKNIEMI